MSSAAYASPTVYISPGSGNQVIAVDAATDRITASNSDVINAHGLVATPDGEYLDVVDIGTGKNVNWFYRFHRFT